MKRLSLRVIVALLTFASGSGAAAVFRIMSEPLSVASPLESAVLPVEYHELSLEPERYVGRRVSVRVEMYVDWEGSVERSYMGKPRSPWGPVFFGFDYAPESEESFEKARGALGVDPDDPKGEYLLMRLAYATLEGEFVVDRDRADFLGRKFPYWFIVRRLEKVERRR